MGSSQPVTTAPPGLMPSSGLCKQLHTGRIHLTDIFKKKCVGRRDTLTLNIKNTGFPYSFILIIQGLGN